MKYSLAAIFGALAFCTLGAGSGPSLVPEAEAAQNLGCVSSYQRDGTIYIHNGCQSTIWWHACVTWTGTGITDGFNHTGIIEGGDFEFSPGPAPFSYYLLTTDSLSGWQPRC